MNRLGICIAIWEDFFYELLGLGISTMIVKLHQNKVHKILIFLLFSEISPKNKSVSKFRYLVKIKNKN